MSKNLFDVVAEYTDLDLNDDDTPMPTFQHGGPSSTGDDIESALQIIEANGGAGAYEQATASTEDQIERWDFPRFPGATEPGDLYRSRTGIGDYDTDVETVAAWLAAPRNIVGAILLQGEPGTGKTSLAQAAVTHADRTYEVLTATPDHTRDSLFTRFVGEGKGEDGTAFVKAVLVRAAEQGLTLIVDEFMLFVDGVKPLFYPLMDGNHFLPEANIDGTAMPIHPETRIIITSNPSVRGASLPEPIASRCAGTTLVVETSAAMLRDLDIAEDLVAAWQALGTAGLWRPQIREMRVANYWFDIDPSQALSAFVPEHAPESQRKQIRDTVMSFIGGEVRADGRLVVS